MKQAYTIREKAKNEKVFNSTMKPTLVMQFREQLLKHRKKLIRYQGEMHTAVINFLESSANLELGSTA